MKVTDILQKKSPAFSFEFFPPKTDEDVTLLMKTAAELKALDPAFISVTWGAGGSTHRKTIEIIGEIKKTLLVEGVAHLTCVGASRDDIDGVLSELKTRGVKNILALRGDPPKGAVDFVPHPQGFRYANELVSHIKKFGDFCVGVAGYPEKHVEAPSRSVDLDNLKRKVDAGADFIVTQLFFDNVDFLRFRDELTARGMARPLFAGIMPVTNFNQLKRFTTMCGAKIPLELLQRLETAGDNTQNIVQIGIHHAVIQARQLLREGVTGIHFYTLNRSHSTAEILKALRA